MLAFERAETIFDPPAGEDGAISGGGLAFDIEFGGPAGGDAVFEFGVRSEDEALTCARNTKSDGGREFEIAWLFEMVVVSDEVGGLLGVGEEGQDGHHGY